MPAVRNILILFSVPYNTGDQALLEGAIWIIQKVWPGAKTKIACQFPTEASKLLPDQNFVSEPESAKYISTANATDRIIQIFNKSIRKLKFDNIVSLPVQTRAEKEFFQYAEKADLILLSPGGYFHDFYEFSQRLQLLKKLQSKEKKTIFLAQSVGPFWKKRSIKKINEVLRQASLILLRESCSAKNLSSFQLVNSRVSGDLSFLLLKKYALKFAEKGRKSPSKFAFSVRAWMDETVTQSILNKMKTLINHLCKKAASVEIHFISTCQGLDYYIDDSAIALKLRDELKNQNLTVFVDRMHRSPIELMKKYSEFDAFIGMRMHAALFAIMSGTPSLCIGYEDKSKGIFSALSLEEFEFHYSLNEIEWNKKLDVFIDNYQTYLEALPEITKRGISLALKNLDYLKQAELIT